MKIAVTYDDGEVFQHFGKTEFFKLYDIQQGRILGEKVISTNGKGHGALAEVLRDAGADALICGGIGGGAQAAMAINRIKVFSGVSGEADAAVRSFLAGTLNYSDGATCDHHGYDEGGCGESCSDDEKCSGGGHRF